MNSWWRIYEKENEDFSSARDQSFQEEIAQGVVYGPLSASSSSEQTFHKDWWLCPSKIVLIKGLFVLMDYTPFDQMGSVPKAAI